LNQNTKFTEIPVRRSQPAEKTSSEGKPITILIVDDDPLVLEMLSEFLRDEGYSIHLASSGDDAIARVRVMPIDIVLVDFKMPGMSGLETIETIADINPETVSILMTGFPTLDSSIKAIKLGASDYLLKPFKLEEVDMAIGRAIEERKLRHEMKSLRIRVAELELGISDKTGKIKINEKVDQISGPKGAATNSGHNYSGLPKK
jgi:DNA-binding NtrC family response regulator